MNRPVFLLLLLLLFGLAACQSSERPTPTPFPTPLPLAALPGAPQVAGGIPTTLADLLENPEFFEGALVQVSGTFGKLPRLVCGQVAAYPSPATWTLEDGDALIQAGGFDEPLRELFPDGLTLTVVGRWQQWRGPVGCGKQAAVRELYYLEVTRLLSPDQLVRVTLTPGGEIDAPDVPLTSEPELGEEETPTAVSESPELPGGTTGPPSVATLTPAPTFVFPDTPVVGTPTPTRSGNGDGERDDDDDGEVPAPGTPGTPTPPADDDDDELPLTPGATTPIPTLPATDRGQIPSFHASFEEWEADEVHNWRVSLQPGIPITISLIAEPGVNTGLRLISPAGQVLDARDSAPAGQVESLPANVSEAGIYTIQTYASDGQASRYFFSLWNETGLLKPIGTLTAGASPASAQIESVSLVHIWFFQAQANRSITLRVNTAAANRFALELYGVDGNILTFDDNGEIRNFQIPVTGWYAVEVREITLNNPAYQITLTSN